MRKMETREIKFRAWSGTELLTMPISGNYGLGRFFSFLPETAVLMQSIGLKDKNGKEVYDGDIVKCTKGCPHQIIWKNEYAGTYVGGMPAWYLSGLNDGYAWTGDEEIIGNIYETPELLTTDQ